MSALSIADVRASVRDLPPLPEIVMELLQSLGSETIGAEELALKIGRDPALASKVLRLANSSLYGMSRRVTSVGDATIILGFRTLRNVVMASCLAGGFPASLCVGFDFKAFWRHTIGTALCAQGLARSGDTDDSIAFTLGLLHDIGQLALASSFPGPMALSLRHQREHDCPALEAERAVLGLDHGEVGAMIAEHWRFPPVVAAAIRAHHEPSSAEPCVFADTVHVADNMAHALDLSGLEDDAVPPLSMPAWMRLGLDEQACRRVFQQVTVEHVAVCTALSI